VWAICYEHDIIYMFILNIYIYIYIYIYISLLSQIEKEMTYLLIFYDLKTKKNQIKKTENI